MSDYVATPEPLDDDVAIWLAVKAFGSIEANLSVSPSYSANPEEYARNTVASNRGIEGPVYGAVVKVKIPRSILRRVN